MSDNVRYSFEQNSKQPGLEKTVKLNSKKSKFADQLVIQQAAKELNKMATDVHQKSQDRQQEIFELGSQFLEILKDRTVPDQKGPVAKSVEREVLQKLITFAIEINVDPNEQEGMGSVSLLTLLLKVLVLSRDKQNMMEHKIHQMEQQMIKLEQLLKKVEPGPVNT